jgi:WD40 repeat protein
MRIWDSDGKELHKVAAAGNSLSVSPDGSLVAVCLQREVAVRGRGGIPEPSESVAAVELWSTKTGELMRSMSDVSSESYGFYSVSFSHDGRQLAANAADGLYVWDAATGKRSHRIALPRPAKAWHFPNCGCACSPTAAIVAASNGVGAIAFFDLAADAGTPMAVVKGHDGPINSLAWRRDGKYLVSGGNDATVILWRVEPR